MIRSPRHITLVAVLFSLTHPQILRSQVPANPVDHIIFSENETDRCLKCHGMQNFAFRQGAQDTDRIRNLTVQADTFKTSVHGNVACRYCHTDVKEYPHKFAGERPKVTCGADCHAVDKGGKAYTHSGIYADFKSSVHGKGLTDRPAGNPHCVSCHGSGNPHAIQKAKAVLPKTERMALCTVCHDNKELMASVHVDADAVSSYRRSFHYKAIRFGQSTTAVCQDCHTVHRVLPADSSASSISPANIASTCGQQSCHPGVNMNFAMSGANHLSLKIDKEPLLAIEEKLFIVLTAGTMAMLIAGIILDIQKKYGWLQLLVRVVRAAGRRQGDVLALCRRALIIGRKILID